MEELQSTEVLDREILEDARKKAHRILKTAEETLNTQGEVWEKKLARSVAEMRERYNGRIAAAREEILARLPLDKRRARSEKIESLLQSAMGDYLSSLGRGRVLSLLEAELRRGFEEYARYRDRPDPAPQLRYRGLKRQEAEALLRGALPPGTETAGVSWDIQEADAAAGFWGKFPAVQVITRAVRITASLETAAETLLEDKRAELVSALLGEGALNVE
jgi:vacuolar-type H+-ATPase subunit E/Vma4